MGLLSRNQILRALAISPATLRYTQRLVPLLSRKNTRFKPQLPILTFLASRDVWCCRIEYRSIVRSPALTSSQASPPWFSRFLSLDTNPCAEILKASRPLIRDCWRWETSQSLTTDVLIRKSHLIPGLGFRRSRIAYYNFADHTLSHLLLVLSRKDDLDQTWIDNAGKCLRLLTFDMLFRMWSQDHQLNLLVVSILSDPLPSYTVESTFYIHLAIGNHVWKFTKKPFFFESKISWYTSIWISFISSSSSQEF